MKFCIDCVHYLSDGDRREPLCAHELTPRDVVTGAPGVARFERGLSGHCYQGKNFEPRAENISIRFYFSPDRVQKIQ